VILVAYASKHGSTQEMALFIADRLRGRGRDALARSVSEISDLGDPEA
jgi:menaquinone-dependent protoporphyrinogen IX oxidase